MSLTNFSILRARRGLAFLILLLTLALAAAWIGCGPPTTRRALRCWWTFARRTRSPARCNPTGMVAPSFMATQIDIVKSERVAEQVVQMLEIDKDPR